MKPLRIYRRHLPHWRQDGADYFVTWCLAAGQRPLLPAERSLVRDALLFDDGRAFDLWAHVVMDDHVHVLVRPAGALEKVIHSWKSFTAHQLVARFDRVGGAAVWQMEYFDRIVRDAAEFEQKLRYILSNPQRRWPGLRSYEWVGVRGLTGGW